MMVTFYTFYPMQDEVRREFKLPAWPYSENVESYNKFIDYLKNHKIFHYQDNWVKYRGRDVSGPVVLPLKIEEGKSFTGYRFQVVLDDKTLAAKDFPNSFLRDPANSISKVNNYYQDTKAWFEYNIPGEVTYLDSKGKIKFLEMEEYIQRNCETDCYTEKKK